MKFLILWSTLIVASLSTSIATAEDGETIYKQGCTGCHDTSVFTRKNRKINSLEGLKKQVRRCSYAIETKWFDDEVDAVASYLNKNFYKF